MEHTKGEWKTYPKSSPAKTYIHIYAGEKDNEIIIAAVGGPAPKETETEANARLIAAAPELLAACLNIEANLSGTDCFPERVADSLKRAKAAVAKATKQA